MIPRSFAVDRTAGAVFAAALLLTAVAESRRAPASALDCSGQIYGDTAPVVLPEPAFTVGFTNVLRWEAPGAGCWWPGAGADGRPSSRRRWAIFVTDVASGSEVLLAVHDEHATSIAIGAEQFPGGGAKDGRRYRFQVQRRARSCASSDHVTHVCRGWRERKSALSAAVESTQDATDPQAALEIEGGSAYTNRGLAAVRLNVLDPPNDARAAGPGFVEFSTSGTFACPLSAVCGVPFAAEMNALLAPGPDGPRTVYARVYDGALGPGRLPGGIQLGRPSGNVAPVAVDSVVLDTHAPSIVAKQSASPAMADVPVVFDATLTRDEAGFNADSGIDGGTAVWSFGDGTIGSGLAVSHSYRAAGTFVAELRIRDRAGNEARAQLPVTVLPSGTPGGSTTTTTTPTQTPDTTDRIAPTVAGIGVRRRGGRGTLLFRVSEPATMFVELRRLRPRPVRTFGRIARAASTGVNRVPLPLTFARVLRRRGTYELVVVAQDATGNVSPPRRSRVVTR